eukprot:scaffold5_cov112-Isochrysis_galbana.AAC.7
MCCSTSAGRGRATRVGKTIFVSIPDSLGLLFWSDAGGRPTRLRPMRLFQILRCDVSATAT